MNLSKKVKKLTLLSASLPVFITVLIATIAAPINTFIASGVSKTSVEAIGSAGGILMMFGVLISLVAGGFNVVIGQYIGAKGKDIELKKATDTTFFLMAISGIVLVVILLALAKPLLIAFNIQNGQMYYEAHQYMMFIIPTMFCIVLQQYFLGTLSIYGYPKFSLYIGLSLTGIDMLLSSIFIFILKMGVMGVIYGTVIARCLGLSFSILFYSLKLEKVWKINYWDWKVAKKIIKVSLPIAAEKTNFNATLFIQGIVIGNIAANLGMIKYNHNFMIWSRAIFNSIAAITIIGGLALSIGLERILSRLYGAAEIKIGIKQTYKGYLIALIIDIPIAVIIFFIQSYFIDFLTKAETNKQAIKMLKDTIYASFGWLILLEWGRATNLIFIAATRSAGDVKFTAYAAITFSWIFSVMLGWVLAQYAHLGWEGIVIAMAVDECGRGLINFLRWRYGPWKKYIKKISGNLVTEKEK